MSWILTLVAIAALPLYVVRFQLGPLPATLLELLVLMAVAAGLAPSLWRGGWQLIQKKERLVFHQPLFAAGALFTLVALVSAIYSPNSTAGLGLWRAYFLEPLLLAYIIWRQVDSRPRLNQLLTVLLGMGTIVSLYAVWQHFTGDGIPKPWQAEITRRVTSWLPYPNALALLMAPLIPLALIMAIGKGVAALRPYRILAAASVVIMILAVWWARSEGALIGIVAGLVIIGLLWSKVSRRVTLAGLGVLVLLVLAVAPWRSYAIRTITLNDCPVLYECSLSLRRTQWVETWAMLKDHPLYGAGLAGYQTVIAPYHQRPGIEIYLYPHNVILNFWSELGLLGLLIFLTILVLFFGRAKRNLHTADPWQRGLTIAALAAMVTLLVHGLVDVPYFKNDLSVLFWVIILFPFLAQRIDGTTEKQ